MAPAPLQTRLLLSFAVATFIAALASVWVLADVRRRMDGLEKDRLGERVEERALPQRAPEPPLAGPRPAVREPGVFPPPKDAPRDGAASPLATKDELVKLDHLIKALQELSDSTYDYYSDLLGDVVAVKREIRQLKATVRNLGQALQQGRPGGLSLGWGLTAPGAPIGAEVAKAYVEDAKRFGIEVEPGRVTARALLNMSPNKQMPIEYFITRYPESGHETLVHLIGAGALDDPDKNPLRGLSGLGTALYKALVAAGFREGEGSHVVPPPATPEGEPPANGPDGAAVQPAPPVLVLATGDVVYLYLRYTLAGVTHVARATDWVLDPSTGGVLPEDCFRFTGSRRIEDPESGEQMLAAELGGLLVSVWPNPNALLEVALDSSVHNDYQYNSSRIPRPPAAAPLPAADGTSVPAAPPAASGGPLLLDLIFSTTPISTEGEGAKPLAPAVKPSEPQGGR